MYNIDWQRRIRWNTPGAQRKPKWLAFLLALISPVISLHNSFLLYRERIITDINTTGQVRILRHALNNRYDFDLRRILILDSEETETLFVFLESENRPVYLPTFINGVSVDFEVHIPIEYMGLELQIRSFIDRFKLVTTQYRIIWI